MKLPVYSRADLSRTVALVVALCLAAASTSAVAREFRAADTQSEDYPTVQALQYMGDLIAESSGRLQIRAFHSRQLGEEKETIEHLQKVLVMSQKAWRSLSAEDQTIFRDAAIKPSQFMRAKWKDLEERSRQKAKAAGVTIVTEIDRKPFEDAMAGICAKAQADPAAAALIERIRKAE